MQSNRLQLNTAKTEVLWCASIRRQHQIPQPGLRVGFGRHCSVRFCPRPRNISGLWRQHEDSCLKGGVHSCFAVCAADSAAFVRRCTRPVFVSLVVSLVLSRLDYCNATLAGITDRLMEQICGPCSTRLRGWSTLSRRTEHVTPLLRDLHWLRYPDRIDYKLAVLVYRCLHGLVAGLPRRRIHARVGDCVATEPSVGFDGQSCCASAFSERHSAVVHSLWQRLKHGKAYRHMSHHLHRWRLSSAASRLSCSWDRTLKPDVGWCSTSIFWLCYVPSKSTLIYVTLIIFVIIIIYYYYYFVGLVVIVLALLVSAVVVAGKTPF